MSKNTNTITTPSQPPEPDRAVLQAVVSRRLAFRFGLSLPVAAVIAAANGLGPREARR